MKYIVFFCGSVEETQTMLTERFNTKLDFLILETLLS